MKKQKLFCKESNLREEKKNSKNGLNKNIIPQQYQYFKILKILMKFTNNDDLHMTMNQIYKINLIFSILAICGWDPNYSNSHLFLIQAQHGLGFQARIVLFTNALKNIMIILHLQLFKTLLYDSRSSMEQAKLLEMLLMMIFQF